jgi:HK97 family phage major capsid protein
MAKTSVELREQRATIISEARKTWDAAEAREGGSTAEDRAAFDKAMDGGDKLLEDARRLERLETAEGDLDQPQDRTSTPLSAEQKYLRSDPTHDHKKRAAFRHWMRTGEARTEDLKEEIRRGADLMGSAAELRDTIISTDAKGGYLVTPVQVSADIVSVIQDSVYIRKLCQAAGSIMTVTEAKKLGIRKKTAHMADADWTTEVQAVTEDTTMAFGRRDLEPYLCSKLAKVSIRAMMLTPDAEREVTNELGYKFGITEEKAYLTGDGSAKPLGIFVADANGIPTSRDVAAASATVVAADDLINVKFSLKEAYQKDKATAWILSRELVKRVRKLKVATTTGGNDLEYIWQPGITEGQPDRILDIPYSMSEYAPARRSPPGCTSRSWVASGSTGSPSSRTS